MLIGARNLMLCPKKITSSVRSSRSSCLTSARTSSRRSRHSAALYNGFDINLTRRSSLASSNAGHRSAVSRGLRDAACCCVLIGVCLGLALSKLGLQGQPKGTERCPQPAHVHPARYNDFDINLILLFFFAPSFSFFFARVLQRRSVFPISTLCADWRTLSALLCPTWGFLLSRSGPLQVSARALRSRMSMRRLTGSSVQ